MVSARPFRLGISYCFSLSSGESVATSQHAASSCLPRAGGRQKRRRLTSGPVVAIQKPLGESDPDLVLFAGILPAVVEVRIVVHLDDEDAVFRLLEIDAVKPVADAAGGL